MNLNFYRQFLSIVAVVFLAANMASAEETNGPAAVTRDEVVQSYLRIQERIHESQLAIEQSQLAAVNSANSNATVMAARLQALEQSVAAQRDMDAAEARKTQQLTLFLAGAFGLAGLGIMLLMVYFQWRAFTQLAQISSLSHPTIASLNGSIHELAAPGRATVESSNARLLAVVGQLEQRINELEGGPRFLPQTSSTKPTDLLAEVQKSLDAGQLQTALEIVEKLLAARPDNADALVKKAVALEKLGRPEEALASCDRAIAADGTLALAHLHKGGLLNRLRRYDEALDCYERALLAQEKRPAVKPSA